MAGTSGGIAPPAATPVRGFEVLPANVPLQPTPSGTWVDCPLEVTLPAAGTYQLDLNARCNLSGASPLNTFVVARMFDVTNAVVVPDSEMLVQQQIVNLNVPGEPGAGLTTGGNQNAPATVEYAVTGPTTIRAQAARFNSVGASTNANIISDGNGRTTLRYIRVGN